MSPSTSDGLGSVALGATLSKLRSELRYEPTAKRIRAIVDGVMVADSTRAVLVWEPKRILPAYAVPADDIDAEIEATADATGYEPHDGRRVLAPDVPFGVHSAEGQAVMIRSRGGRTISGFRPADPALEGYVVLAFDEVDNWLEEDDKIIGHPHDPLHRIDVRGSRSRIRFLLDGETIVDTERAKLLFETGLPVRYYVPANDVQVPLERTATTSICAYKGHATYYSATFGGRTETDLAWQYEHPLVDGSEVQGLMAFFDDRLDLEVDGVLRRSS